MVEVRTTLRNLTRKARDVALTLACAVPGRTSASR